MMTDARNFNFPEKYTALIRECLAELKTPLEDSKTLAGTVQDLSRFYTGSERLSQSSPWKDPFTAPATLSYFFPLNYLRIRASLEEGRHLNFFSGVKRIVEMGSGVGTAQLAFLDSEVAKSKTYAAIEPAAQARHYHQLFLNTLFPSQIGSTQLLRTGPPDDLKSQGTLAVFSYVLNEVDEFPKWALNASHILILEPSTRHQGRQLLMIRRFLMEYGFFPWAPCTHNEGCPLLELTSKDWCHDRIFPDLPDWYKKLETHLPFKNRSLTFSYLLMARTPGPQCGTGRARVIGDTQKEKGKVRQMICRKNKREFLSWLTRKSTPPFVPRGTVVDIPGDAVEMASEIRMN